MKNVKFTISYDGSRYLGWQRLPGQQNKRSIQGILEQVLFQVTGQKVRLKGSGRTDKGVHALGQVANAKLAYENIEKLRVLCNEQLPEDICILRTEEAAGDFHSRYSAKSKIYEYHLDLREVPSVFSRKHALWVEAAIDIPAMEEAAKCLMGRHDFGSFCNNGKELEDRVRTIYDISFCQDKDQLILRFQGDGFLYNMVRILTGTLLEVGMGKRTISQVEEALRQVNRQLAGPTVSSVGLFLHSVSYEEA